jgi:hypothetical protein
MSNYDEKGAAAQTSTLSTVKLDPAAVASFWQSSMARLMRSSEIFRRGMTEVARLETELGQQLLQRGMVGFKPPALGGEPEARVREQFDQATQEFESLIISLRRIADESRTAYSDATLALFETSSPAKDQFPPAAPHVDEPLIKPRPNAARAAE